MPSCSSKPARGALVSFPKRTISPLQRACQSLGLPVDARPRTNLARLLRRARLGNTAIEYLKFSKGEQARQIVDLAAGDSMTGAAFGGNVPQNLPFGTVNQYLNIVEKSPCP